jgi:hypothetical protein
MLGQAAADGSGNATLTLASLAPGSSVIYAAYPGSRDFAPSTSLPLALQVFAGAPSFTVHAAAASLQLSGLTASLGLTLVPANGYDGEVALSCSSSSPAVTCTPSPAELAGNLAGTPVTGSLEVSRSSGRAELPLGGWLTGGLGLAAATRRRRRVAMAALAVAALLVPGCGGGRRAPVTLTLHAQGSATGRGTAPAAALADCNHHGYGIGAAPVPAPSAAVSRPPLCLILRPWPRPRSPSTRPRTA